MTLWYFKIRKVLRPSPVLPDTYKFSCSLIFARPNISLITMLLVIEFNIARFRDMISFVNSSAALTFPDIQLILFILNFVKLCFRPRTSIFNLRFAVLLFFAKKLISVWMFTSASSSTYRPKSLWPTSRISLPLSNESTSTYNSVTITDRETLWNLVERLRIKFAHFSLAAKRVTYLS